MGSDQSEKSNQASLAAHVCGMKRAFFFCCSCGQRWPGSVCQMALRADVKEEAVSF